MTEGGGGGGEGGRGGEELKSAPRTTAHCWEWGGNKIINKSKLSAVRVHSVIHGVF